MSGPHVGSIPIFFDDSQMEVWFTMVFEPRVCINLSEAPPVLSLPHFIIISLGCPFAMTSFNLSATSFKASSQETLFHLPLPLGPTLLNG